MRKIYSLQDRIRLQVGDLEVVFRPLSYAEKSEIQAGMLSGGIRAAMNGAFDALKTALVEIKGLANEDGSPYVYSPEKLDDILNLPECPLITKAALNMLQNVPSVFKDPETNLPLAGVEIIRDEGNENEKE